MHDMLQFARGPLFRLAFLVMALGLLRLVILALWGIGQMIYRARDRNNPYSKVVKTTLTWLIPIQRLHRSRPWLSYSSFLFHVGLIVTPIFLLDHIHLWRASIGLSWPGIPKTIADALTLLVLASGILLIGMRIFNPYTRRVSGFLDYFLVLLILLIFSTGFIASRPYNPIPYETSMLIHVLSADILLLLAPFTKIAHCVLFPLVRMTSELAWKFPPEAGKNATIQVHGEVKPI